MGAGRQAGTGQSADASRSVAQWGWMSRIVPTVYVPRVSHPEPCLARADPVRRRSPLTTPVVAQSLSLEGPAGAKVELSAADVGALPRVKFVFDAHGDKPAAQPHKH